MAAKIPTLIEGLDNSEVIRDAIGAILVTEQANQCRLATDGAKDPLEWGLRVFVERAVPWAEWVDAPVSSEAALPIVNVSADTFTYDRSRSDAVERQQTTGIYNIDCYGYGISEDDGRSGHVVGDAKASFEAQRAARLVRKILMSAHYINLGMTGVVADRWPLSIKVFQPQLDNKAVQHVMGARLALEVTFNEFSPQHVGVPLSTVFVGVLRQETGELYFDASYDVSVPP